MISGRTVPRTGLELEVRRALRRSPIVALIGPRQCGKSTLARGLAGPRTPFFDLEHPVDAARLSNAHAALSLLRGLVVIDEVQLGTDLFPVLRVLADRPRTPARFLILGSASPDLVRGSAESLAGRVAFVQMTGFGLDEIGLAARRRLWLRGGFPRSYLASSEATSGNSASRCRPRYSAGSGSCSLTIMVKRGTRPSCRARWANPTPR
jgi:predicted AAA+ superfamily ATPase